MTIPLPDTNTVEAAVAARLTATGAVAYSPVGVYDGQLPAVFHGRMPATPDDAITVNLYADDRAVDRSPHVMMQVRCRTAGRDPRTTNHLADTLFGLLHDQTNVVWGGLNVLSCRRMFRADMGADENGRYERADNYLLILNPKG